jgi:hypothetical protein
MLDRITPVVALDDLARDIDAEHNAVATALQSALGHAIAAGELLIEAKRQVRRGKGKWLPWLEANSSVPWRTASHYMRLAKHRAAFCDENGNVLPISVTRAMGLLNHYVDCGGINGSEWDESQRWTGWGRLAWGKFGDALETVTHLTQLNPPKPRYVVQAARAGKTPGLTAEALREAIALLTRYAEALERETDARLA